MRDSLQRELGRVMQMSYWIEPKGHAVIYPKNPEFPFVWKPSGQAFRCRYVAWLVGKLVNRTDVVHHKDCNPLNDDPDNLEVLSRESHTQLHTTTLVTPERRAKIAAALRGRVLSPESKAKISASLKGNTNRKGSVTSPEALVNLREAYKTRVQPRERISETLKRKYASGELKVVVSEEQKAKISAARMGHTVSPESREKMRLSHLKFTPEEYKERRRDSTRRYKEKVRQQKLIARTAEALLGAA